MSLSRKLLKVLEKESGELTIQRRKFTNCVVQHTQNLKKLIWLVAMLLTDRIDFRGIDHPNCLPFADFFVFVLSLHHFAAKTETAAHPC